jgi:hypothetical protein
MVQPVCLIFMDSRPLGGGLPVPCLSRLAPNHLTRNVVAGAIIISEACYGAELAGRTIHNSVPLKALSEGALAFGRVNRQCLW